MPVLDVLSDDPTAMAARGEHLFACKVALAAPGAGNYATLALQAARGSMVVVTRVLGAKPAAGTVSWMVQKRSGAILDVNTPATPATTPMDSGDDKPPLFTYSAAPNAIMSWAACHCPATYGTLEGVSAILRGNPEGDGGQIVFEDNTANEAFNLCFIGWWRRCGPEEY